ncbi:ABC transporter substrate-binding protein (plasmid) [Sinorhizobium fredii CCBAU 25509]|nr:ABC transporter substrate-binding protein [Sinorhizobium fredii CCBAU 25509]
MNVLKRFLAACLFAFGPAAAVAEDLPQLRAAMLASGTVNWEISTIKVHEFDRKNGFELAVQDYADNGATRVAFEGGEADTMVADWIWVANQRAAGKDYVFIPYSLAVGDWWSRMTAASRRCRTLPAGRSASPAGRSTRAG